MPEFKIAIRDAGGMLSNSIVTAKNRKAAQKFAVETHITVTDATIDEVVAFAKTNDEIIKVPE